jgi:hypothetical protein
MAQSTVKRVQGNGDFKTQNGQLYSFEYEFEDGVIGMANHVTANPRYKEGESVNYEIQGKDIKGNNKLKFAQPQQVSNFKSKSSNKSFALAYAKDLVIAGNIPVEKILETADRFNNWMD